MLGIPLPKIVSGSTTTTTITSTTSTVVPNITSSALPSTITTAVPAPLAMPTPTSSMTEVVNSTAPSSWKLFGNVALSEAARNITNSLISHAPLPADLTLYASLAAMFVSGAAIGSSTWQLYANSRPDKKRIQLAVFHILRMFQNLGPAQREHMCLEPQLLKEFVERELRDEVLECLSKVEAEEVVVTTKRRIVEECFTPRQRKIARTLQMDGADGTVPRLMVTPPSMEREDQAEGNGTPVPFSSDHLVPPARARKTRNGKPFDLPSYYPSASKKTGGGKTRPSVSPKTTFTPGTAIEFGHGLDHAESSRRKPNTTLQLGGFDNDHAESSGSRLKPKAPLRPLLSNVSGIPSSKPGSSPRKNFPSTFRETLNKATSNDPSAYNLPVPPRSDTAHATSEIETPTVVRLRPKKVAVKTMKPDVAMTPRQREKAPRREKESSSSGGRMQRSLKREKAFKGDYSKFA